MQVKSLVKSAPDVRAAAPATATAVPFREETRPPFVTTLGLGLYLLFIISWFLQLGRRYPILGAIRFDLLLVMAISALCLLSPKLRPDPDQPRRWTSRALVFVLLVYAVLTVPFVEWPGSVLKTGLPEFFKAVVFCLFTGTLVRNERGLRCLLIVFVGCQAFRVLEPLYLHVTQGYWGSFTTMANWEFMNRLAGAPYDIINPNGLAFVAVTTLVFCHFLCPLSRIGLAAYLMFVPLAMYVLALTASRTGLLALFIVISAIWWKSRRKVLIAVIVAVVVGVAIPLMSDDLADRYLSMFDSNAKNARTVTDRSVGIQAGFVVAMRRPLFGHGLGTSQEANANFGIDDQPAHNLYVQIAQELGFIGLPLFIALMVALSRELKQARAQYREAGSSALVARLTDALQVFLLMNLMFSLASYGLSSYEWYLMAGLGTVSTRLSAQARSNADVSPVAATQDIAVSPQKSLRTLRRPGGRQPETMPRLRPRVLRDGFH